jgi:myosin heavy subunit
MTTLKESFTIALTAKDSIKARNAFNKALYDYLFTYIVSSVNSNLAAEVVSSGSINGSDGYNSIGVLDIFGFESFERNEFQQLLINYANEVLQSTFNEKVFQSELALYEVSGRVRSRSG